MLNTLKKHFGNKSRFLIISKLQFLPIEIYNNMKYSIIQDLKEVIR